MVQNLLEDRHSSDWESGHSRLLLRVVSTTNPLLAGSLSPSPYIGDQLILGLGLIEGLFSHRV